ncbi:TMV resistance protein N-like [Fagus crenata]
MTRTLSHCTLLNEDMRCDHLWFCYVPTRGIFSCLNLYDVNERLGDTQHPFFPIRLNPGDSMGTLGYHISSGATKYQPPRKFWDSPFSVPDYTLGLEFGLDLPDLGFDSTVSEGFDLGSSSMPNNDDSDLGLLPLFPTSYASHSNSIETTNNEFDPTLKGFHGDGCDLSLLPHAYPMGSQDYQLPTVHISLPSSEGLDLPALASGSTVSEGFDLGSGSMPHNDDSDFNLGSSSMPNNDDSDLGLLPLFPTSYASHSNSIETTNNEFDSTLKGFHGDGCDLSLLPHAYPMGSQDYQPPTVHISLPSSEGLDLPALASGSTENLKDGTPSFLTNISGTILSSGEVLDGMRECRHKV